MNARISDAALDAAMSATFADYRADGDVVGQINLPELLGRYGAHHAVDEASMMRAILEAALPHMHRETGNPVPAQASPAGQGDARTPSQIAAILRAMASNYSGGHSWDHLDSEVCAQAAAALAARQPVGAVPSIDYEDLLDQAKDLIHCGCSVNGAFDWLLEQLTGGEAPAAPPAQAVDQQYVDLALHYGAHANRMRLVLGNARACIEAWSHPAIIEHSKQRMLQQIDEMVHAYAKREPLPAPAQAMNLDKLRLLGERIEQAGRNASPAAHGSGNVYFRNVIDWGRELQALVGEVGNGD